MLVTVLLAVVVLLAFVVEATAGFGATIVTVTLASHFVPIEEVLAAFLPVNVLLSAYLTLRHWRAVDTRLLLGRVVAWMGPGMGIGIGLFALRGQGWIRTVFAAFVVVLASLELRRALRRGASGDGGAPPALSAPVAAASLVGAGVVHGLFACGGPMLVYVVGRELADKARFRATLSAVWLLLNLVLLVTYAVSGTLDAGTLRASATMLVSLVVGLVVGEQLHRRLPERAFRIAVFALLLFAGGALLVRSALGA